MISAAQHELNLGSFPTAVQYANSAGRAAPLLNDYAQYIRAQAEYKLKNYAEVNKAATQVFDQDPVSPLQGAAAALAVNSNLDADNPKQALELVRKYFDRIPQPQASLLLARCFEATGDLPQAAQYFLRVYYDYPSAKEAADAATALTDLKSRLGAAYPPLTLAQILGRAEKLFHSGNPAGARIELAAAIPQLSGAQQDVSRVKLGEADFFAGHTQAAFEYLSALKVNDAEADAERLCYLIRVSRKLNRDADVKPFLQQLEQQHSPSPWRLDALVFVADQARAQNDLNTYLPLYRACAAGFSNDRRVAWCNWRVSFESYRKDAAEAYDLLRTYIQQFPDTPDTTDALYFLGRLNERKNDYGAARACYEQLVARFPNSYFAIIAREQLKTSAIDAAMPSPAMKTFLDSVNWPSPPQFPSFTPGELPEKRIQRATALQLTGLNDFAEQELSFGARNDSEQPNVYAFELAKLASARGAPDQALRYIRTYAPGYLYVPLDEAPVEFWQFAFPIPFRASIETYSREQKLDPFLVAALIRQESEFDVKAISPANAYGLMQVLPVSGRQIAHHFRIRRFTSSQLLTADRNIEFGTYFLRTLIDNYAGQPELALAAYNAGPGHASVWRTWGPFREQAEFIEMVPFHETRGYIQIVLRNADVYRRLYAGKFPDVPAYRAKPAPKRKPRKRQHVAA